MKAIIVDDSPQARKLLRLILMELAPSISIVQECGNAEDGQKSILELRPDLVFLDIEMPGKSGLQLAEELIENNVNCAIVFTTAYNEYAINAFRLSAVDYLLKPIQEDQLLEAIEKVRDRKNLEDSRVKMEALAKNMKESKPDVLCVPIQGGFEYIPLKDILYLEADGSYVRIACANEKHKLVAKNLKYFENSLKGATNFVRAHRSFIVNMTEVVAYSKSTGGSLVLGTSKIIPVSRERKSAVLEFLDIKTN